MIKVVDVFDNLPSVVTAIGAANYVLKFKAGTYTIASNLTVPANITLDMTEGALLSVNAGVTLTINGDIVAGSYQIISLSSSTSVLAGTYGGKFFDVKWVGCKGDGSTDDYTALHRISGKAVLLDNELGENGNFTIDSNLNGIANGITDQAYTRNYTMSNNEQYYEADTTSNSHYMDMGISPTMSAGDKFYACAYLKTTKGKPRFALYNKRADGSYELSAADGSVNSGTFEFLSVYDTITDIYATPTMMARLVLFDEAGNTTYTGAGENLTFKKVHVFNLTKIYGAGSEPTEAAMDSLMTTLISTYSYINEQAWNTESTAVTKFKFPSGTYPVSKSLMFDNTTFLDFEPGALLKPASGHYISVEGKIKSVSQIADLSLGGTLVGAYRTYYGSTSPIGSVVPNVVGEEYFDTVKKVWYKSKGLTNSDWNIVPNDSEIRGLFLDKDYYYQRNTKLICGFQSNEVWVSGLGTQSNDTSNLKIGSQSLKILENDNTASSLYSTIENGFNLDLSKFNDGSSSSTNDYIYVVFYASDVTKFNVSTAIQIQLCIDTTLTSNRAYYTIATSGVSTGWNYVKIAKSAWTSEGTFAWSSAIKTIRIIWDSAINAQNAYVSFQCIGLMRKDPSSNIPNPFQREINGVWTRDFAINAGEWFVGLENGEVVCRNMNPTTTGNQTVAASLISTKGYSPDFTICLTQKIKGGVNNSSRIIWEIDANNRIGVIVYSSALYLYKSVAGVNTGVSCSFTCLVGDIIEFILSVKGSSIFLLVVKNGDYNNAVGLSLSHSFTSSGYLSIGDLVGYSNNIVSASIAATEHAHHSDIAELAKSVENKWKAWTPTVAWTTGTPEGSVAQTARYTTMGNTCYFNYSYTATDGNGATALTITLPVTPKDNNAIISLVSQQKQNTTWTNPLAYIDDDSGGIQFRNFSTCTDSQAVEIIVTGFYEV